MQHSGGRYRGAPLPVNWTTRELSSAGRSSPRPEVRGGAGPGGLGRAYVPRKPAEA
jgi:hypothetical protein